MTNKKSLHSRHGKHVGEPIKAQAFSGVGFMPDVISEHALSTFPAASATLLEEGVNGREGMMPAPGTYRKVSPATLEGGTGGAGSFNTATAADKNER